MNDGFSSDSSITCSELFRVSWVNRWWSPSEFETEIHSGTWAKRVYLKRLLSSCRVPLMYHVVYWQLARNKRVSFVWRLFITLTLSIWVDIFFNRYENRRCNLTLLFVSDQFNVSRSYVGNPGFGIHCHPLDSVNSEFIWRAPLVNPLDSFGFTYRGS